jgi:hypothetical protein
MVGRIEVALIGLLGVALMLGLNNQNEILRAKAQVQTERKEVELLGARTREVNATAVLNEFSASRAVMIRKVWTMENFLLHNPEIRSLRARRAVRSREEFRLEGNVTLLRNDGAVYEAERVRYDTRAKVLRSIGPFFAHRGEDRVRGLDFVYETVPRRTTARDVVARYRLEEGRNALR